MGRAPRFLRISLRRNQLIRLIHVHLVGGLHGHALQREAEGAGLRGLLVGGDDARGVVLVDGQLGLAVLDEALPCPLAGGGVDPVVGTGT